MPIADENAVARVYVSAVIPADVARKLDLKIAEERVKTLRSGSEDAVLPSRSSYIRNALLHYLTCLHVNSNHKF